MNRGHPYTRLLQLAAMLLAHAQAEMARADEFTPIGEFRYAAPAGGSDISITNGQPDFNVPLAKLGQQQKQYAEAAISKAAAVLNSDIPPIKSALHEVADAQAAGKYLRARAAAQKAVAAMGRLIKSDKTEDVGAYCGLSGNANLKDYCRQWANYIVRVADNVDKTEVVIAAMRHDVATSLSDALGSASRAFTSGTNSAKTSTRQAKDAMDRVQAVARGQTAAEDGNTIGVQMLSAASAYEGRPYEPGMQCTDLVRRSAAAIGIALPVGTAADWYQNGMGPDSQVLDGADGVSMQQLASDIGENRKSIPLGSVIVSPPTGTEVHGHAALYNGVLKVDGRWQLIVYDANGTTRSWEYSILAPSGPLVVISFPPAQTGLHVTRKQWSEHPIKVFKLSRRPH